MSKRVFHRNTGGSSLADFSALTNSGELSRFLDLIIIPQWIVQSLLHFLSRHCVTRTAEEPTMKEGTMTTKKQAPLKSNALELSTVVLVQICPERFVWKHICQNQAEEGRSSVVTPT